MGGFTVDGFGVGDSFYPKLGLGQHYCSFCKSMQEFALMEVRRKIKLLYIPTVSINTKYAVGCAKCKSGYYITDEQRDEILYRGAQIEVKSDGIIIKQIGENAPARIQQAAESVCPKCGREQPNPGKFCSYCGASLQFDEPQQKNRICKTCGAAILDGQMFCTECGTKC